MTTSHRGFRIWAGLLIGLSAGLATAGETAQTTSPAVSAGSLGAGTAWETPWYLVTAERPGPTVMITGGLHGNEPAGSAAAEQIRHWPISCGRLLVVPRVNRLGLLADLRWFPPARNDRERRDLNRNFPGAAEESPRTPVCEALWALVEKMQPDLVLDLHEGFDFHRTRPKSVGSSIIFTRSEQRSRWAEQMLAAVNRTVTDDDRRFEELSRDGAVAGSLVRACHDVLGIDGFILETTFKGQPLSLRTRQQRTMVSTLLRELGLISRDCVDLVAPPATVAPLRVALFDAAGTSTNGLTNLSGALDVEDVAVVPIGPADIRPAVLAQFDVLLFPGGSGSKQAKAIGADGRKVVCGFARSGGGIVGVCAGAYLCSSEYDWSLHVINTAVYHDMIEVPEAGRKSMWYRGGAADVQVELTPEAAGILGRTGQIAVRYHNGPIVSAGPHDDLPAVTTLAWFRSEVSKYEPQQGTMVDTPAIVAAPFGDGRVVAISPHPEATPGLESLIEQAVRWAAGGDR